MGEMWEGRGVRRRKGEERRVRRRKSERERKRNKKITNDFGGIIVFFLIVSIMFLLYL